MKVKHSVFIGVAVVIGVMSWCCATREDLINIKKSLFSGVDYDGFKVKANYASKKDKDFIIEMEEYAAKQKWERYDIRYYYAERIGSKRIKGAIIYFWEIKLWE